MQQRKTIQNELWIVIINLIQFLIQIKLLIFKNISDLSPVLPFS